MPFAIKCAESQDIESENEMSIFELDKYVFISLYNPMALPSPHLLLFLLLLLIFELGQTLKCIQLAFHNLLIIYHEIILHIPERKFNFKQY